MPELVPEAGPSFNQQQGQEPTSPLPVQPEPMLIHGDGTVAGILMSTRDQASSDSDPSSEDAADHGYGHSLWILCHMLRHYMK